MTLAVHTTRLASRAPADTLDVTRATAEDYRARGSISPGEAFALPRWLLNVGLGYSRTVPPGTPPPPRRVEVRAFTAWYMARYREAMEVSQREHSAEWAALLARESVTLACVCTNVAACHRGELAKILVEYGAVYGGEL